ncbi:hypothetical protein PMAYCL1PPCAC_25326, partial [Pristionchus mayeri]
PYSTMPSADEVAQSAKANVRSSLSITHNLTLNSSAPSDFILHRMNEVLRSVIDTNFDASSMDALGALYTAIGDATPHMVANAHDLALVNLSRTFAVVIDEAIKIKGKPTRSSGGTSGGAWGNAAHGSGIDAWQAWNGNCGRPFATSQTTAVAPISDAERARRRAKDAKKDYSPEAIEGRITIFKIPFAVTELQLRGHFTEIDEIIDLSYPTEHGKHKGFALMKFKDNKTADDVVAHLHGSSLGGAQLSVERARHWFKQDMAPVFGTGRANAGSSSGPGSGPGSVKPTSEGDQSGHPSRHASASSSLADTVSTEYSVPAPESYQGSGEDAADDEEEDSSDEGSDPGIM